MRTAFLDHNLIPPIRFPHVELAVRAVKDFLHWRVEIILLNADGNCDREVYILIVKGHFLYVFMQVMNDDSCLIQVLLVQKETEFFATPTADCVFGFSLVHE